MILLWLTLSVLLAGLIARYNESNKLFWILFTSFVIGIAGGHVYQKFTSATSHSKEYCIQASPIQGAPFSVATANVTTENGLLPMCTTVPDPVSQDSMSDSTITITPAVSKCCVKAQTPPPNSKPLQICTDSLIHPDRI